MTATDMTTRDAAQTAALPKSAVWSVLDSRGVLGGGAGSRSLTSERTEYTSSPATSGVRPKRSPLAGQGGPCDDVRKTMRQHTTHGNVAGVARKGGFGDGRAVWQDELRGGVADPPHSELASHAGRAVLVTACDRDRRRGGRPNGVHLLRSSNPFVRDRRGGFRAGSPAGSHPSGRTVTTDGRRGWTCLGSHPLRSSVQHAARLGWMPAGIHPALRSAYAAGFGGSQYTTRSSTG
jgi:hypothetical protein